MTQGIYGQGEGTLSTGASLAREARADFDRTAARLTEQIADVRGRWGGAGAAAFFALHDGWQEKQRRIVAALDRFADALDSTEKLNYATDHEQGARYGRLQQRL